MSGPRTPRSLLCPRLQHPAHSAITAELSARLGSLDRACVLTDATGRQWTADDRLDTWWGVGPRQVAARMRA